MHFSFTMPEQLTLLVLLEQYLDMKIEILNAMTNFYSMELHLACKQEKVSLPYGIGKDVCGKFHSILPYQV